MALLAPFPDELSPQDTLLVRESPGAEGSADLVPVLEIREGEHYLPIHTTFNLMPRPNEGWIYTTIVDRGRLFLLDANGGVESVVGRPGDGPGEFRSTAGSGVSPNGLLPVHDPRSGRRTWVDPVSGEILDTERILPLAFYDIQYFSDGTAVVALNAFDPELAGKPLHLVDADFQSLEPLSEHRISFTPRDRATLRRRLDRVQADDDTFWVAHIHSYTLEEWSRSRGLLRVARREIDWFPDHSRFTCVDPDVAPNPGLVHLQRDPEGYLLVLLAVPADTWRDAHEGRRIDTLDGQPRPDPIDRNKCWDTVVEVIDLRSGSVIARARSDILYHFFVGPRTLAASIIEEDGMLVEPYLQLVRLEWE